MLIVSFLVKKKINYLWLKSTKHLFIQQFSMIFEVGNVTK